MQGRRILLGVTGGIAAFKAVLLLRLLTKAGAQVRVIMTQAATRFVGPLTFEALSGHSVATDLWATGGEGGESHIQLAEWCDLIVIAPATANTLAKCAQGRADCLLSATYLAASSPVLVCPAMHTRMFNHMATQETLEALRRAGVTVMEPAEGDLASGCGVGRLPEPEAIFSQIERLLANQDLQGMHVVVTAGPTRESLDPVRFISNRSTGKMGYAIARAARCRGAQVTLITGPTCLTPPDQVKVLRVETAQEMWEAVQSAYACADGIVMSAAVGDFRPKVVSATKLKKASGLRRIQLEPTMDILAELGKRRATELTRGEKGPILIGFAMETEQMIEFAQQKLLEKRCDMIVANDLNVPGAGFGGDTNQVTLIESGQRPQPLKMMSKRQVAEAILDRLTAIKAGLEAKGLVREGLHG